MFEVKNIFTHIPLLNRNQPVTGLRAFGETMKKSAAELSMLGMFLLTGLMLFSTAIYFFERDEKNSKFYSIPAAWWWAIISMTTVQSITSNNTSIKTSGWVWRPSPCHCRREGCSFHCQCLRDHRVGLSNQYDFGQVCRVDWKLEEGRFIHASPSANT